jgi:hypothetical protein
VSYVFEPVSRSGVKTIACSGCGRKIRRQRTFEETLNPWNVNAAGEPKTRAEIYQSLAIKIEAWQSEPEHHAKCVGAQP